MQYEEQAGRVDGPSLVETWMIGESRERQAKARSARRRAAFGRSMTAIAVLVGGAWATSASGKLLGLVRLPASNATLARGEMLFNHEWRPGDELAGGDGLGPVFNAESCAACHFVGGVGGAGPNERNVTAFEVAAIGSRTEVVGGVVHDAAVDVPYAESMDDVTANYRPIRVQFDGPCNTIYTESIDPVRVFTLSTPALWGVGLIDRVTGFELGVRTAKRTAEVAAAEFELDFDTTSPGQLRILEDGRIGKFGWKGQFATLEEFVANACAGEIGLSNPAFAQAEPRAFAGDDEAEHDLSRSQVRAIAEFCRALPRPERFVPADPREAAIAERGEELFAAVGCTDCHTPSVGGIDEIYTDFRLHRVDEQYDVKYRTSLDDNTPFNHPPDDSWKTTPLWGVADTAPYWHDGSAATLEEAILRHGGEARLVTERFEELSDRDRAAVVAFLKTLRGPNITDGPTPTEPPRPSVLAAVR